MMNDNFSHDELNEINYLLEELQRLEALEAQELQSQYSYANSYMEEDYYYESSSHAQQPTSSAAMAEEVERGRKKVDQKETNFVIGILGMLVMFLLYLAAS